MNALSWEFAFEVRCGMSSPATQVLLGATRDEWNRLRCAVNVHGSVLRARDLAREHPDLSLHLARRAAEAVCQHLALSNGICADEKGLDAMRSELRRAKALPEGVDVCLHALQGWGNLASHPRTATLGMDAGLIGPCLATLDYVYEWYLDHFGEIPPTSATPSDLRDRACFSGHRKDDDGVIVSGIPGVEADVVLPSDLSFQDLLDVVWTLAVCAWEPFTYGTQWWLADEQGRLLLHSRTLRNLPPGSPCGDDRPMSEVGIRPGGRLKVIQAKAPRTS